MNEGNWFLVYTEKDRTYTPSCIDREKRLKAKDEEAAILESKRVWAEKLSDWSTSSKERSCGDAIFSPNVVYKVELKEAGESSPVSGSTNQK